MLIISNAVHLPDHEIELSAICVQDTGGRNVNKVSSAMHLCFGIQASSLPPSYKERLLALNDQRISDDGVVMIKTQRYQIRGQNREDVLERLTELIRSAARVQKAQRLTKPMHGSQKRQLGGKIKRGAVKVGRGKVDF